MPNQNEKAQLDLDWQVEILRVTAFPGISKMETDWWDALILEPPESKVSRPKEGINEFEGLFENGKLFLHTRPTRIDWLYKANVEKSEGLPTVGSFYIEEHGFFNIIKKWMEIFVDINRLAFGAALLYPVSSREEGYESISNYLPKVELDPNNSFDFLYQINRPRLSTVFPSISINRLSKWSVVKLQRIEIELRGDHKLPPSVTFGSYACRLELDINTSQQYTDKLPEHNLVSIFDELSSLAYEISQKGDIK